MDFHILFQTILYFCIFIAGFVVAIPVGVNRLNFQGDCVLYADIHWKDELHMTMQASSPRNCNVPIYYSVFGMIFYGLAKGIFYAYATFKSMRNPLTGYQMWTLPYIFVNGIHTVATLVVSCMLSFGFLQFCNGIKEKDWVSSCGVFANRQWTRPGTGGKFNAGPYTVLLATAQVASWTCFLLFLLQTMLGILRLVRNRRHRSAGASVFNTGVNADTKRIAEHEPTA